MLVQVRAKRTNIVRQWIILVHHDDASLLEITYHIENKGF